MKTTGFVGVGLFSLMKSVGLLALAVSWGCEAIAVGDADSDDAGDGQSGWADTGFTTADGVVYPGVDWPVADPAEVGLDPDALDAAAALAEENDSHCLVVTKGGKLVREWYFDDWDETTAVNVYSVTKSVTGLAIGVAVTQGYLDIEEAASAYVSAWQGTGSEEVLIKHLMSNTSGRAWDFTQDNVGLALAIDVTDFALGLGQAAPPGTVWVYSNSAVQTLDGVLAEALGESVADFAEAALFEPIGASSAYRQDSQDNTLLYSELSASCRDLARFGYLVLRDGKWGNDQLIDSAFLDAATSPSSTLNSAYGYLWWLNRDGHWVASANTAGTPPEEGDGKMLPNVPEHIILARGFQNQMILVDKENDLVFSRIGGEPDPATAIFTGVDPADDALVGLLAEQVLSAIVEAGE